MSATSLVFFLLGLVLLVVGAEALVRGASRLAAAVGVSPLVVGLTVVAFGTSAPELAVSISAAVSSPAGANIALGNVVGSNIFNVLFILGVSALVTPLVVSQQLVRRDVPLMIGASVVVWFLAADGRVGRLDGLLLVAGIIGYTTYAFVQGRNEGRAVVKEDAADFGRSVRASGGVGRNLLWVAAGLGMLVLGSRWLVQGAVALAQSLGVSDLVIGLTVVAAGTSLPEVATSVMAGLRGERDIAVGNVVGSNLFNLLCVLGGSAAVAPGGVMVSPVAIAFDLPVMTATAVACLPIFFTGHRISRWEGGVFLGYYIAYVSYLMLTATQADFLPTFRAALLGFVVPLTVLTLVVAAGRQWWKDPGDQDRPGAA